MTKKEKLDAEGTYEQFKKTLDAVMITGRNFVLMIDSEDDPDGFAAIYGEKPFREA